MRHLVNRFVVALGTAGVLAMAAGVPVFAQYGPMEYEGPLFWLRDNRVNEGHYWHPPPVRSWPPPGGGEEWSAATAFPERVWIRGMRDAPPNDNCVLPSSPTDTVYGPWGLQVTQYFAEWWEGTTYDRVPGKPPGWTAEKFGFFDFADNGRSDRLLVSADGLPQGFPGGTVSGAAGACAARELATQRGRGNPWDPLRDDGTGECLADPQIYRLRVNLELRCEPDLSERDDYTAWFYSIFDPWPPPVITLSDGTYTVPVLFPSDYVRPVWFRRSDYAVNKWLHVRGNTDMTAVFNVPGGESWNATRRARPEYLEYHRHRYTGTRQERRASPRNNVVTFDAAGNRTDQFIMVQDLMTGQEDCVAYETSNYESPVAEDDWICGRVNASGLALNSMQEGSQRYLDVGMVDPAGINTKLRTSQVWGAQGVRQPVPAGGDFWLEFDSFSATCASSVAIIANLPAQALAKAEAWHQAFLDAVAEHTAAVAAYNAAVNAYHLPEDEYRAGVAAAEAAVAAALARVFYTRGTEEGWRVILAYREQTQPLMEAALGAVASLAGSGTSIDVFFDGAPPAGCTAIQFSLQPIHALGATYDVPMIGGTMPSGPTF